jgi:hypothetical protein
MAADGKRPYRARCSSCHGDDGSGGGHGPNIVDVRPSRATSKEAVISLILKGIPDGGMPAFQVPSEEADAIATYVMALKSPAAPSADVSDPRAVSGDRAAGQRYFTRKGITPVATWLGGRGGVLGPDLSNIGRDRHRLNRHCSIRERRPASNERREGGDRRGPIADSAGRENAGGRVANAADESHGGRRRMRR